MSIATVAKNTLFSATSGFPSDFSASLDLGTGVDRYAFVCFRYEKWTDIAVQAADLGGQAMVHVFTGAAPNSNHAEYLSVWALENPPEGQVTLSSQNGSSSVDVAVTYMVLRGLSGTIAPSDVHNVGRDPSDDGSMSVDIDMGKAVVWFVVRDRGGASDWEAVAGSEIVTEGVVGQSGSGMSFAEGFADPESAGPQNVGAVQVSTDSEVVDQELILVAMEVSRSEADDGGGDPDPDPEPEPTGETLDIRVEDCVLQKKRESETAWTDVQDLTVCSGGGGSGDPQGVEDVRVDNDVLQQKKFGSSAYVNVVDLSQYRDDGGGGSGDTINVEGRVVTSSQLGYNVTNDPVLGRQRLQAFIDDLASFGVPGVINAGAWAIDGQLDLHDGLRLMGEGMQRTVIDCPPGAWTTGPGNFTAMRLDAGSGLNPNGVLLRDFKIIGADKTAADSGGGLIRLHGLDDFLVERVWVEDASSYGIFVAGYGEGSFTNDIESDFWNSTFRGVVRNCVARRGQIGIGTEGGAEGILIMQNDVDGLRADGGFGLHCYRSASGRNVRYVGNRGQHCRTGFLIDRHRHMEYTGNWMNEVRYGWAIGGYNGSDAPAVSRDVKINYNYYNGVTENGNGPIAILDSFQGNSTKHTDGLTIHGNQLKNGNISLRNSRRVSIQGNIGLNGDERINTHDPVDGIVANNLMDLGDVSPGVVTSGANQGF